MQILHSIRFTTAFFSTAVFAHGTHLRTLSCFWLILMHTRWLLHLCFKWNTMFNFKSDCASNKFGLCVCFGSDLASVLQEAEVRIINETVCSQLIKDEITPQMICAGILTGGVDACQVEKSNCCFFYCFFMHIKSVLIIKAFLSPPSGWLGGAHVFWRPSNQTLVSSRGRELGWRLWPQGKAWHLHTGRQVPQLDQRGEWGIKCTYEVGAKSLPLPTKYFRPIPPAPKEFWPILPASTDTLDQSFLLLKKYIPVFMNIAFFVP